MNNLIKLLFGVNPRRQDWIKQVFDSMCAETHIDLNVEARLHLTKIASGKVRDLYDLSTDKLFMVATDRISAYDVVMKNGIPNKGAMLTAISIFWFKFLEQKLPHLQTHFIDMRIPLSLPLPDDMDYNVQLGMRCMTVRRLDIIPIESIVRGYIAGSAWAEYQQTGTIHGIPLPAGLKEGQRLPTPMWTPSTKAAAGSRDVNLHPSTARALIGNEKIAEQIENRSLEIYMAAAIQAMKVGIILADTKLEFGLDRANGNQVVLADEVLTPDSSRFWPFDTYEENIGKTQPSLDKQFLRDWLVANDLKGKEGVIIPDEIAEKTAMKYREVYGKLVESWPREEMK